MDVGGQLLDIGTFLFLLFALALFCQICLFGGLIAYAAMPTKLAFALGTMTFAATVGLAPFGHLLAISPTAASRLLEAWLASAAVGLVLRLAGTWRRSAASGNQARRIAAPLPRP